MNNLLFISIAFPPKSDPECIQSGRYYNELQKNKLFNIQVLTSASPTLFMDEDKSLNKYLTGSDNIIKVKIFEWKIINWLLRKLLTDGIDWPDSKFTFHKKWKMAVRKVNAPDIIYSRSFPLSSTIMAYKLSTYFNVPWVLHLSDPWSISPIHNRTKNNQNYHNRWEKKCFEKANAICFTSEATISSYSKKYPTWRHKFNLIPNLPHEASVNNNINWGKKLRIVFTGGLGAQRTPYYFIKALQNLINKKPAFEQQLELIFAGNLDRSVKNMFNTSALNCVKHIGNVSLVKSIELQQSAHILLSIDNEIVKEEDAMFIPSKLFDYIKSGRVVVALTTKNSATEFFLKNYSAHCIKYNDTNAIELFLSDSISRFLQRETFYFIQGKKLPKDLDIKFNCKKLMNILNYAIEQS